MTGSNIDRTRAQILMQATGLDALVLFQPESIAYATGAGLGVAGLFRRAGAGAAVVPADPALAIGAVLPDLGSAGAIAASGLPDIAFHRIWVDTAQVGPHDRETSLATLLAGQPKAPARPATFDARAVFVLVREQLASRGLAKARLGVDLAFVPVADFAVLKAAVPEATLIDATETIGRLKMVKTPREIAHLRVGLQLSELGLAAAVAAIRPGVERAALSAAYTDAVRAAAAEGGAALSGQWDYISIGTDPWGAGTAARDGDIIKFDVGAVIAGYSSDMARVFALGQPSQAARELHAALLAGLDAGLAMLRPGVRLCDVHATVLREVRRSGVPNYTRGHFGHGLGNDPFSEQWPFIAGDCTVIAEPGMVLAVEAPLYVDGLGGFIIEEQVLVTNAGIEVMSTAERGLRSV